MSIKEIAYREGISKAIADEMRQDPRVLIMGEDIAESEGPLKTTLGLFKEFGPERVRDTPISETAFVGAALGLAIAGYRPIVEIMFADFLGVCFDQIANSIAKHRFMSGGQMSAPLVIRIIGGGGLRFGPQHSQTCESWLLSVPGLKIVAPSSPAEAYGMLRAAIKDPDPVLVLEHKALLGVKGPVNLSEDGITDIRQPAVRNQGSDVTIVATLAMVEQARKAADALTKKGIHAEVIDLRVLRPLDPTIIVDSVKKTSRLITVEEQSLLGGWGSHIVAAVVEQAFDYLDAPPVRIGLPESPLPYSPSLEDNAIPDSDDIQKAVCLLLEKG
ncbi:MAG: alpha-ketoacid dehydrogenase subunit beta [Candidatus Berkelbacteria bacterium]|nr:alpha-ketoacid dehydrogenase subunit beta [Candidatus Berkelbacteria bacterium]